MRGSKSNLLQRAADLSGRSLTDSVIGVAQEAALPTLREFSVITLSAADQQAFVHAMLHPPEPSSKLSAAWKRYKKRAKR